MVADESGMDINMEKLMKLHNQKTPDSKKILELKGKIHWEGDLDSMRQMRTAE